MIPTSTNGRGGRRGQVISCSSIHRCRTGAPAGRLGPRRPGGDRRDREEARAVRAGGAAVDRRVRRDSYRELSRGTLDGLAAQITNLQAYATNTFLQSVHIRGIGLNEFQGQYDSPVAQHIDEVYVSKPWMIARRQYDIAARRGAEGPAGHAVRAQHDRRRRQLLHGGAVAGIRCRRRGGPRRARAIPCRAA